MCRTIRRIGLALIPIIIVLSPAPLLADPLSADAITSAITTDRRTAGDADRDGGRKPGEVLSFLGLSSGMKVMDVMASGGWYTEVLSLSLGETGTVYAQNIPAFLQFREGAYDKAMSARLVDGRLPNVVRLDRDFSDLGLANEIDLAITALNLHDIYNRDPAQALGMLRAIKSVLKPHGVLGVVDHNGADGNDNAKLHRMTLAQAVALAREAGFMVEPSDLLRNPDDDLSQIVFAPGIRGNTDRFLLKLIKPAEQAGEELSLVWWFNPSRHN